jgi:hypothetical protein
MINNSRIWRVFIFVISGLWNECKKSFTEFYIRFGPFVSQIGARMKLSGFLSKDYEYLGGT